MRARAETLSTHEFTLFDSLSGNSVCDEGVQALAEALAHNSTLKELMSGHLA